MAAAGSSSSFRTQKGKQAIIDLSSSSSDQEEEDEESEESEDEAEVDEEEEGSGDGEDEDEEEPLSEDGSGSTSEYDDDEGDDDGGGEEEDDDDDAPEGKPTNEELCNRVVDLLQRRRNLNTLKLDECKAYLRKHQLRLSGTKATCIERILEHWRIKDGNGEKLYPRASFLINCTGDVCKGDVILFKQRVYEKFDIVTRGGNIMGKRIIAGKVVKESYGAAKQQHTFTVEILWSKGVKALPPLFPLLVKGRNLYRLKTFRQRWSKEAERSKVLAEKHKRGATARHVRAIAKARSANRGSKRHRNSSTTRAPPNKRRKKESEPATRKKKHDILRAKPPSNGHAKMKQVAKTRHLESSASHPEHTGYHENGIHRQPPFPQRIPPYNHYHTQIELHRRNEIATSQLDRGMFHLPSYNASYSSAATGALHHHILNRGNYMSHPYANPAPQFDPRNSSHMSRQVHFGSGPTSGEQFHRWRWP